MAHGAHYPRGTVGLKYQCARQAYLAQSRDGDAPSVKDVESNNYVVSNPTQRKELNSLLTAYRYDQTQDLKIPIALTKYACISLKGKRDA